MQPLAASDPDHVHGYRLLARLGGGGMGRVYLAASRSGRLLAVKVLRPDHVDDATARARFAREAEALRRVSGVYTAPLVEAGPDDAVPWLAMAFLPGLTLRDAVERHGPLPPPTLATLAVGLAEATRAVHATGVVHRDLKPSNILLAEEGPRVIDFGVAHLRHGPDGSGQPAEPSPPEDTDPVGTVGYLAPEQASGHPASAAGDVFSLGALLYHAATGQPPFPGGGHAALHRVLYGEPDYTPVPEPLSQLLRWCLAKDPAQRPDAATLLGAIPHFLGPQPPAPAGHWLPAPLAAEAAEREREAQRLAHDPPRRATPTSAPRTRRRVLLGAAGVAAVAALAGGAFVALWDSPATAPTGSSPVADAADDVDPSNLPAWTADADLTTAARTELREEYALGLTPLSLAFDPDDPQVLYEAGANSGVDTGGALNRFDLDSGTTRPDAVTSGVFVSLALVPDGETALVSATDGSVSRVDLDTGDSTELVPATGNPGAWDAGATLPATGAPQARLLAATAGGAELHAVGAEGWSRFDGDTLDELDELDELDPPEGFVGFAPHPTDHQAAVMDGATLRILDTRTGEETATTDTETVGDALAAYSTDGSRILVGSQDTTVRVFDTESLDELDVLRGHDAPITALAASPNGEVVVSGSDDGELRVWDPATGELVGELDTTPRAVRALAWSTDSTRLAAGFEYGTVRIYQLA